MKITILLIGTAVNFSFEPSLRRAGGALRQVESYADLEGTSPDYSARQRQIVFRNDQRERPGNCCASIGKLQSGTGNGKIANNAGRLLGAILDLRRLRNAMAGSSSGLDHEGSLPIHSIFVTRLVDPKQRCSAIQPDQPLFVSGLVGMHV